MMASVLGFELLPALNEGDERICLADVLMLRDSCLSDTELWAVCMETCLGIQEVNSSEMFQTLCITPESLAFDASGAACFLDLATDPETMYIPPEYETVGNSYKAHLYSLGMTMLFAAEYNAGESLDEQVGMGEQLSGLVTRMTADEYDERASLPEVMRLCEQNLKGRCSQKLCKQMAAVAKLGDSSTGSDESSSYDEDSPVPKGNDFLSIVPDGQSTAGVIDLQNDLPKAAAAAAAASQPDAPPPLLPAADPAAAASSGSGGAITPPAAFRNSAEDYKRAIVESPVGAHPFPLVSPPKVSRMMAQLDNGEITTVEMAAGGSGSGNESAADDGSSRLLSPTPPTPVTPLSQKTSPVPSFELGASQNSAFQVVWSPRSSKTTSPVPPTGGAAGSGIKDPGGGPSVSLHALADTRLVSYANLLSVALDNSGVDEASLRGNAPSSNPTTTSSVSASSATTSLSNNNNVSSVKNLMASGSNNKAESVKGVGVEGNNHTVNNRTDSELRSARNKLDELMAKYGQKLSPRIEVTSTSANIASSSDQERSTQQPASNPLPHHDLPALVRRSHLQEEQQQQHTGEGEGSTQPSRPPPSPSPSPQPAPARLLQVRRDELDFEFGDSISPVPTFVRRGQSSSPSDASSDAETDSLEETEEEEHTEEKSRGEEDSEKVKRGGLGGKLRVSVVKLRGAPNDEGSKDNVRVKPQLSHITAGQLRRLSQTSEARQLAEVVEEEEEEQEQEQEGGEGDGERDSSVSCSSSEGPSHSRADLDITDDSDATDCSDFHEENSDKEDEPSRLGSDSDPEEPEETIGVGADHGVSPVGGVLAEAGGTAGSGSGLHGPTGAMIAAGSGAPRAQPRSRADSRSDDDDKDVGDDHGSSQARPGSPPPSEEEEAHLAAGGGPTHQTCRVGGSGASPAASPQPYTADPTTTTTTIGRHTASVNRTRAEPNTAGNNTPPQTTSPRLQQGPETLTITNSSNTAQQEEPEETLDGGILPQEEVEEEDDSLGNGDFSRASLGGMRRGRRGRVTTAGGAGRGRVTSESTAGEDSSEDDHSVNTDSLNTTQEDQGQQQEGPQDTSRVETTPSGSESEGDSSSSEEEEEEVEGEESVSESDTDTPIPATTDTSRGAEEEEEDDEEEEGVGEEGEKEGASIHKDDGQNTTSDTIENPSLVAAVAVTSTDSKEQQGQAPLGGGEQEGDKAQEEETAGQEKDTGTGGEAVEDTKQGSSTSSVVPESTTQEEGAPPTASSMMSSRGLPPRAPTGSAGPSNKGSYGEPDRQTQTVQEMLEKLGCGLQETELWALCRECVHALSRYRYDLPAYLSLETVFIEEGGEVGYQSVPDDRELEVVYLAPELQQHGVVTEKTCLFGIAAMLWSAADYKLPQNQEPALSEQLENLLISMTQDNQDLRPAVTDVLQVCSEYDRKHEVSSRLICQGLYSDAQKAEAFGKDNALVRDILGDVVKSQQASRQAQIVDCIKITAQLQSQLKPVSERQLAEKPVVRSLHDKLMDEILNPPKKLRKSSRPKIVDVRDIFLNNPDLMADLRRVVGNQRHVVENSAFMATAHNHQQRPLQPGAPHTVPNAFQSTATHFSPIVVSANGQQAVGKPQLRAGEVYGAEKERKVAKKMRELKKNLLKTRPTQLNIAQDVEKDAMLQEQVISGNLPNHHHHPHLPHHNNLHPHHLQQQHPHLLQGGAGQQGQPMMNGQISPGHLPSGQLPGQMPGQVAGGQGGAGGAGLFPFQVQLQHDPRTGLFQLIPISVQQAQQQQQQAVVQQPVVHPPVYGGGPAHPPPNAHSTPNAPAHPSGVSEAQEMANQIHRESEQRRRYLKHTEEELKARVKAENVDHQRSRSSTSSSSRTSQGHKVKSRSRDKDGHHRGRSHTVATSDLKDDLARATNNVRSRAKEHKHSYSSGTNLKKSNSEENILDKVDKPSRSRSHRSEDARTRLKRAKSGSSLDYRHMEVKMKDVHVEESNSHNTNYQHRQRTSNRDHSSNSAGNPHPHHPLSKSQPHLDLDLPQDDVRRPREAGRTRARTNQAQEDAHLRSPLGDVAVSPPPSPSLSKDSGVSGLNMKSSGELTLMERLLNSDTIRHQQRLSKVICLLRDEFAFDGYMENGVEDFAMAEYILSLGNLKWETFNNAITEKYCDLFWQDELLTGLFEAVNGTRPVIEKRVPSNPKLTTPRSEEHHSSPHHPSPHHPQQASPHRPTTTQRPGRAGSPKPTTKSQKKTAPSSQSQPPQANHASWNGKDIRTTQDTITGSAFRPIRAVHPPEGSSAGGAAGANHHHPEGGPVFIKPKPLKAPGSHTDTSDSTDNEVSHRPRRYRKKQLEKAKSSSMHDLLLEKQEMELEDNNNQVITKSHSQGDLIDTNTQPVDQPAQNHLGPAGSARAQQQAHKMGIAVSMDGIKPKVVYIRSSESENDSYESNTNAAYHHHQHPYHQPQEELLTQRGRHMRALANSSAAPHHRTSNSFAYRYDSDSSSTSDRRHNEQQYNSHTLPFQRQNPPRGPQRTHSRDDTHSESSRGSSGQSVVGRRLVAAKSEGYLNVLASGDEFGSRERMYSGSKRMFRGSVVYYPAEMEHYLRPEIREFAVQVWNRRKNLAQDTRTKENIEAKMATLDQEMMVEHRQKRKTLRFYQKLVEANRTGKGGDQKSMMSKVAKQLIEMNTKLEFLDSAKKHLEMLYAEQWGLDHYLLYSLSECPPDEPMLLSACENPHLQYQVLKASTGGEGHVLQAGLPEGLMAYLFAQNALSEGYIHQFFYCFRYFVTPAEFLDFLMIKFVAASLSLSPDAAVPVKVKARSVDLLQVWIEGYYSIDFKHNPDLTNLLYDFIKDKVTPVEASAEYLLEVLEDAQDDRHLDLYYPQFCVADDYELQLIQAEAPPKKWESFKAALHLSAKPQKLRQPVKTRVSSMSTDRYLSQLEIDKCDHDAYFPRSATLGRLGDEFLLSDYTSQTLAEQLSLMEQDLFRQSHPVHYLNSKAQGVGVALTTPAINKAQSMYRLTAAWEDNQESSLFVGTFTTDDIIQRMIEHSQAVSFWVAAEIVCCDTSKAQVAAISKFLTTARLCQEMRNFATCISILDGLENVLVRQVPAWRNLQTKYAVIMDELASIRVFLKSDAMCLLETDAGRSLPTIPCVLLFLLHVQQLEIGGFRLANTMYKWPKMKAIAKVIDQIRIFKDHSYTYVPDYDLQDLIRQRMRDLGQQDLHVLAAQHDNNFQKVASRMPAIFKRMKGKMGKSSEG